MKKVVSLLVVLMLIFSTTAVFAEEISVYVNGEKIEFDRGPQMAEDTVLVPVRFVAEKLGSTVHWDGETQTVFLSQGSDFSMSQIGNSTMFRDSEEVALKKAPVLNIDRTLVDFTVFENALNAKVTWDEETSTVTIEK